MFKSAILGCRGRARAHAKAYESITRGKNVAICDMNEEALHEFGDAFDIGQRYTDIDQMLEKEKPDLLHIVTAPVLRGTNQPIRYPLMNIASEHQVPAVIIEKPIAVMGEDWRQIRDLSEQTATKIAVNTQLHFHPQNLELKKDVAEGRIGEIKLIEASSRNPPVDVQPPVFILCGAGGKVYENAGLVTRCRACVSHIARSVSERFGQSYQNMGGAGRVDRRWGH